MLEGFGLMCSEENKIDRVRRGVNAIRVGRDA